MIFVVSYFVQPRRSLETVFAVSVFDNVFYLFIQVTNFKEVAHLLSTIFDCNPTEQPADLILNGGK